MKMLGTLAPVTFLALALCGCTAAYKAKIPDVSGSCPFQLQDVPPVPLTYGPAKEKSKENFVEFGDIAKCLRINEANEPIALYRLDGVLPASQINVKVALSPGGTFAADVQILNSSYVVLKNYDLSQFVRREANYSLSIFLNNFAGEAAYVLIAPDKSKVGTDDKAIQSTSNMWSSSIPMGAGYAYATYRSGTEKVATRPFLTGGKLQVSVEPTTSGHP